VEKSDGYIVSCDVLHISEVDILVSDHDDISIQAFSFSKFILQKKGGWELYRRSFLLSPRFVFFYWCCWHGAGVGDAPDGAYFRLHKVHGVVVGVSLTPYAYVPFAKNVPCMMQRYPSRGLLG
jgi:hypothetical protein